MLILINYAQKISRDSGLQLTFRRRTEDKNVLIIIIIKHDSKKISAIMKAKEPLPPVGRACISS
jgi:hypothetical protein